jgi:DNA replicative helicase MCM subunit Mcm2 (Cdc46/Mcm family)
LIFVFQDKPDEHKDDEIFEKLAGNYSGEEESIDKETNTKLFWTKWVTWAREYKPKFTKESLAQMKEIYKTIRNSNNQNKDSPVPINPRQVNVLFRMAQACARMYHEDVQTKHVDIIKKIFFHSLDQTVRDPETGQLDTDRLTLNSQKDRNKKHQVIDVIKELTKETDIAEIQTIVEKLSGKVTEEEIDEIIKSLKKDGTLYEPKSGKIKLM